MLTAEDIKHMSFFLEVGKTYSVFGRENKKRINMIYKEAEYLGESGIGNSFLIFRNKKTGIRECFLKIDIIIKNYKVIKIKHSFEINELEVMYG